MLAWRLAVSVILVPAFVGLFYLDWRLGPSAAVLFCAAMLIAARSAWELVGLFQTRSFRPSFLQTACCSCLIVAAAWIPNVAALQMLQIAGIDAALVFGLAVLWLLASNAARYRAPGQTMETLGAELLIVTYAGLLLCLTMQLRWLGGEGVGSSEPRGTFVLSSLIVVVKFGDIGAYTFGRLFGRRKMSPLLSPGKTWAGGFGALVTSALAAWVWLRFGPQWFHLSWTIESNVACVIYGLAVGAAGLVGDLCESLIKRDLGKKDAAALMPGFGGLIDLTDSVIYAGPVAYLLWRFLPFAC